MRAEPAEWADLCGTLAEPPDPPEPSGEPLGFEIVGLDGGRWHTRACPGGLVDGVHRATGIRPGPHGLVMDGGEAVRAAEWLTASGLSDPKVFDRYAVELSPARLRAHRPRTARRP